MPSLNRPDDPQSDWTDRMIPTLAGGVNGSSPAHLIEDSESPDSENVTYRDNRARVDTGYSAYGEYVAQGISATTSAGITALAFTKGQAPGLKLGAAISVVLDGGTDQLLTTITALDTTSFPGFDVVTMADAIPAGRSAPLGSMVTQGIDLWGVAQRGFEHQTAAGIVSSLLVTTKTVYIYVGAPHYAWHYVAGAVQTTLSANASGTDTVLTVVDETGFSAGDRVAVLLDNGAQHQTTVAGTAAGSITLDDQIPGYAGVGVVATSGKAVLKAVELAGAVTDQAVTAFVPWEGWSVFTNGIDPIYRYDGSTCELVPNLPNSGDTICKTLGVFSEAFLILGNIIQSATPDPYQVIWCAAGDAEDWSSPTSGSKRLLDSRDPIVAMKTLGSNMIIYRTRTPVIMAFLGRPYAVFSWAPLAVGESLGSEGFGPVSPNAVAGTSSQHIILDRRGIFLYTGDIQVQDISGKISDFVFGPSGIASRTALPLAFAYFRDADSTFWAFYADSTATYPNRAVVLDTKSGKWWHRKFSQEIPFASSLIPSSSVRIIDLQGAIAEQLWRVGAGNTSGASSAILLGISRTIGANDVLQFTDSTALYDGITSSEYRGDIPWSFDSSEFWAHREYRLDHVKVYYKGPTATLSIIRDGGQAEPILTIPAASVLTDFAAFPQTIQRRLRFRIAAVSGGAELSDLSFKIREEARWGH